MAFLGVAAIRVLLPLLWGIFGTFIIGGFITGIFKWFIILITLLVAIKILKMVF